MALSEGRSADEVSDLTHFFIEVFGEAKASLEDSGVAGSGDGI